MGSEKPLLEDGYFAFVKEDCPTCTLVEPVLAQIAALGLLKAAYSQDNPNFPALEITKSDMDLEVSFKYEIDTVPTLIKVSNGEETERIVGWLKSEWEAFCGIDELDTTGISEFSPGCGSRSVDPDLEPLLREKFGSGLRSQLVEFASREDEFEAMYELGWSDGLPVVPPTEDRVIEMLDGTSRSKDEIIAIVPPNLDPVTVEKIAVNAVMAGCRPEYLPVVISALEAVCTDEFNMHGLLATTMPVGPVLFVNGPIRNEIGMNSGMNLLGQGNRANSTIGRAVQLIIRNVGGGRPGEVDRATHGSPAKVGLCFAEDEEGSPWPSYSQDLGFGPDQNTVTVFPGEGPRVIVDQLSRFPDELARSLAQGLIGNVHPKLVLGFDAILIISPEHADRFKKAGWSKQEVNEAIISHTIRESDLLLRGVDGVAEGLDSGFAGLELPKFRPDSGLVIVYGGGRAGLFSTSIGGWLSGSKGSQYVTREIQI